MAPNDFELCSGAPAFIASLRDELSRCHTSVFAQFMTFEGDASGNELAEMLLEKSAEGIQVRLILDCYTDVIANDILPLRVHRRRELQTERANTRALLRRLEANGVEIKRTAPPGFLWRYLLFRNHKKMVVLDDRVAFVGGINVSDHNYAWNDFMAKISGLLAGNIARDFCTTWEGSTVALAEPAPEGDFVLNQCPGRSSISDEIVRMIEAAERSVVIESPSLLDETLERALLEAAQRNVQVKVIIPARHNRWIFRIWVRATLASLAHPNITVYRYEGSEGMTHAKLLIVDDRSATFGSLNMFELESLTQKELNVFTRDAAIVGELSARAAHDIASSHVGVRPRWTFGRFTYRLVFSFFQWWTGRLVRDPAWRSTYC